MHTDKIGAGSLRTFREERFYRLDFFEEGGIIYLGGSFIAIFIKFFENFLEGPVLAPSLQVPQVNENA